jgi:hypothetical protein
MGARPNLNDPQSFNEKLLWLMFYWRHPLKTRCADKYAVRDYVKEHGLEHILNELLGVYENSSEIYFKSLPQRFVLKCTHGCGFNIVCNDKSSLNVEETCRKLDAWMNVDYSKIYGESHYARIKRRIICEAYLNDLTSDLPTDYKIYCFDGKAHCTRICTERTSNGPAKYDIYDREWNQLPYLRTSLLVNRFIPKPAGYEEMIEAAEKLSKPFPFVRVDFYNISGKVVFGEMTFTPYACTGNIYTDDARYVLGSLLRLPAKRL